MTRRSLANGVLRTRPRGASDAPPVNPTETNTLRRRHVIGDDGAIISYSVSCRSLGSVDVGECNTCARCLAMPADRDAAGAEVVCKSEGNGDVARGAIVMRGADVIEAALRTPVGVLVLKDVYATARSTALGAARTALLDQGLEGLPVIDDEARPIGIVTRSDLLREGAAATAGDAMSVCPPTYPDDAPLVHALPALSTVGSVALVVDRDERLIGMLAASDVVVWLARRAGYAL